MSITNLKELFIHDLSDVYSAERQITKALPKMARAATDPKLVEAFKSHLEETQGQIERLDQVVESSDELRIKRMKCHAMEGLVEEAQELIDSVEKVKCWMQALSVPHKKWSIMKLLPMAP